MGLTVHVDGGSRGNPGPAGAGVTIRSDDGKLIHEGAYFLGHQTNNSAEYHALIRALQRVERCGAQAVAICSDSELLVRQITGEYRVKSPRLSKLYEQVQLLLLRIPCWNVRHIPREENQRADELANLAMNMQRDVIVFDAETGEQDDVATPADSPAAVESGAKTGADSGRSTEAGHERELGTRVARVSVAREPRPGSCPVGQWPCDSFTVEKTLPAGICIHAAHALLPTILAVLNTDSAEFAAVPTLTVRCMRPECGATFHVSPARSGNGAAKRDETA